MDLGVFETLGLGVSSTAADSADVVAFLWLAEFTTWEFILIVSLPFDLLGRSSTGMLGNI